MSETRSEPRALLAFAGLVAWLLALAGAAACRSASTPAPSPSARPPAPRVVDVPVPEPPLPPLTLHPSGGPEVTLRVEIVATPSKRQRGLMFRKSLPADRGMLFVFPRDGDYPFYMKDTYIPLDLLYLDASGRVVGVIENMRPLDETSRGIGRPARYVLEVNAHSARRWGIGPGDRVTLPDFP